MADIERISPELGQFFVVEHAEDDLFDVLFIGWWASMTDLLMARGIINSKEKAGDLISVAIHEDDEEFADESGLYD